MKKFITLNLIIFYTLLLTAQTVENVHSRLKGDQVIITYDLKSTNERVSYFVELSINTDNGMYYKSIKTDLTGDVGDHIAVGINKSIIWYPFRGDPNYTVEKAKFKVQANRFKNYTETTANLNLDMVAVKGGVFSMGSRAGVGEKDERPQHTVIVSDFYIGKYEVTQAQWRVIMGKY